MFNFIVYAQRVIDIVRSSSVYNSLIGSSFVIIVTYVRAAVGLINCLKSSDKVKTEMLLYAIDDKQESMEQKIDLIVKVKIIN